MKRRLAAFGVVSVCFLASAGTGRGAQGRGDMAGLPGGTFTMGTDPAAVDGLIARFQVKRRELFASELPAHRAAVKAYSLDRMEVTNRDFKEFVGRHPEWSGEGGVPPASEDDFPVVFVTRPGAIAFCESRGKRLPTEAEWEFAATNGGTTEFPWGNDMPDAARANWLSAGIGKPARVGSFPPTHAGIHDLAGNVWEFVSDDWRNDYSDTATPSTVRGVIRGGSFGGSAINLRGRFRDSHPMIGAGPHVGFRCAR